MAIYEVSDDRLSITVERADRLNTVTLEMGSELVEVLVPFLDDELVRRRPAAGDAPQSRVTYAAGSSP